MTRDRGDLIELRAIAPDADLACDFEIANEKARAGLHEDLSRNLMPPVRKLDNGVEVRFRPEAWDIVVRYVELESRCCPFLDLSVQRDADAVLLRVTGRPDARDVIYQIFEV